MSRDAVRAWRDRLLAQSPPPSHLHPRSARAVWNSALQALTDDAIDAIDEGPHYRHAVILCVRTVLTAPIEWCAVLLARGSRVTLKVPHDAPGWSDAYVAAARAVGLPLSATTDRAVLDDADFVVAMGTDETVSAVASGTEAPTLRLGHRFSVACVHDDWDGLARDVLMHDGRGCFTPVMVFSTRDDAAEQLARSMERASNAWPAGEISPIEGATRRARGALARVVGRAIEGADWSVHVLPAQHIEPVALPRSVALCRVKHVDDAVAIVRPWQPWLSCVATDMPKEPWSALRPSRIEAPGHLQAPALHRVHDGIDWVRATRP